MQLLKRKKERKQYSIIGRLQLRKANVARRPQKVTLSYHNDKKKIKYTEKNKTVATAIHEAGAEIITKALNFYFGDTYTRNQAVEMMNQNTSNALKRIADHLEKHEYTGEEAVEYLRELSEEMSAQALVVSMRDELKFDKPNNNEPEASNEA